MAPNHVGTHQDTILRTIESLARAVHRAVGSGRLGVEDIQQQLWLHLLDRQDEYDAGRAAFPTFADRILTNAACDIIRHERAQCRATARESCSLNDTIDSGDGVATSVHETIASDVLGAPGDGDLQHDLDILRARLTPEDRRVLDLLRGSNSQRSLATHLKVSRRQIANAVERIRRLAIDLELDAYLDG